MITAIFALLPIADDADINILINGFDRLSNPSKWQGGTAWVVEFSLFVCGTLFALLAQIAGAFIGWKALRQASELAPEGDFQGGNDALAPGGYGQGAVGGGYGQGGGQPLGGGGGHAASLPSTQATQARAAAFQPFQGSGQRLGDQR